VVGARPATVRWTKPEKKSPGAGAGANSKNRPANGGISTAAEARAKEIYIFDGAAHSLSAFMAVVASFLLLKVSAPTIVILVPAGFLLVTQHFLLLASMATYQVLVAAMAGTTKAARMAPVSRYLRISVSFFLTQQGWGKRPA